MPARSQAQFGKVGVLYRQHKLSRAKLREFNKGVHPKELPKHVRHWRRAARTMKRRGSA